MGRLLGVSWDLHVVIIPQAFKLWSLMKMLVIPVSKHWIVIREEKAFHFPKISFATIFFCFQWRQVRPMVPQMELTARTEATETRMFLTLKALLIIQQLCIHPQPPLLRWLSMDKPCNNLKLPRQNTRFVLPFCFVSIHANKYSSYYSKFELRKYFRIQFLLFFTIFRF